jgi:hypothetical protein
MKSRPSIRAVLTQLQAEGFSLPEGALYSAEDALQADTTTRQPWYIRLFIGISAWIASILFMGFLVEADIIQDETGLLISGLAFMAIAVGLNIFLPTNVFVRQFGLALSLAGQALFIYGLVLTLHDSLLVPTLIIAVEVALIIAYNDRFHRILSTVIIVGTLTYVIYDQFLFDLIHVLILGLALATALLYQREPHIRVSGMDDTLQPLGMGFCVSLLGLLLIPLGGDLYVHRWWISAVLLLAVLIYVILEIAADLGVEWNTGAVPWLLFGAMILFFPALRTPGIFGAIILLVLGFWRNNRVLIGIASVFTVFYMGAFYYSLVWTLLQKSFALMGTGIILLLLRYAIFRFGEEEA